MSSSSMPSLMSSPLTPLDTPMESSPVFPGQNPVPPPPPSPRQTAIWNNMGDLERWRLQLPSTWRVDTRLAGSPRSPRSIRNRPPTPYPSPLRVAAGRRFAQRRASPSCSPLKPRVNLQAKRRKQARQRRLADVERRRLAAEADKAGPFHATACAGVFTEERPEEQEDPALEQSYELIRILRVISAAPAILTRNMSRMTPEARARLIYLFKCIAPSTPDATDPVVQVQRAVLHSYGYDYLVVYENGRSGWARDSDLMLNAASRALLRRFWRSPPEMPTERDLISALGLLQYRFDEGNQFRDMLGKMRGDDPNSYM
ncbi:hypothetical protein EXIGLDRAFT_777632 [Exidia glandulosa HHB12029]|uniref:Uncharacterized protein n=1 Tax=Exidia glandulosa HHB12029 TaxID=1314781 RepID=A0A165CXM3_EXIGL|nr:hypothetical protein EXIGLDRAFT_777632 [Exidia glandulosa HHB12029]